MTAEQEARYWQFVNDDRTVLLDAFPGIKDGVPGSVWALERRERENGRWLAPDRDVLYGDFDALLRYALERDYTTAEPVT